MVSLYVLEGLAFRVEASSNTDAMWGHLGVRGQEHGLGFRA